MKSSKDKENRSWKNSEHEETELILRVKEGDHQAFETLYYLYKNQLLFFLTYSIDSIEEAEDIVQDVFIKIWNERENIDERKNFKGYIFKIAKNYMIDHYRKYSREKVLLIAIYIIEETPEDILVNKEKQSILQEALNQLSLQQKKIYKLHYEQRKCLKDVANEMNLSISTIQNHINKMIKSIYKYFDKKNYF